MKIKFPKFGKIYTYHKDNRVTVRLGFIKPQYTTHLQVETIRLGYLEITIYIPSSFRNDNGDDVALTLHE